MTVANRSKDETYLIANRLYWSHPNGETLFSDISLSLGTKKVGLVGRNGVGKTTLLRMLVGELPVNDGELHTCGNIAYLPQNFQVDGEASVADILNVAQKLAALHAIENGSVDENDFEALNDHWNIENELRQLLLDIRLPDIELSRKFNTLSGGEATRIYLAGLVLDNPDLLILDEPTNNLDRESKQTLYQWLADLELGILIVSHDRALLNIVDEIIELTTLGMTVYQGDYDHYWDQKQLEEQALQRTIKGAEQSLKKTKREIQKTYEKHQQRQAKGRRDRKAGSQSKLILNARQERSEGTSAALKKSAHRQEVAEKQVLKEAKEKLETVEKIDVSMIGGTVPNGKTVLEIKSLNYGYEGNSLFSDFSLSLFGPDRVWLRGDNGSGKTTLLKLIQATRKSDSGVIKLGVENIAYLDQHIDILDKSMSILENFQQFQPDMSESDIRMRLAKFLFRKDTVYKLIKDLSGGERLRAAMACLFMHSRAPQLLLLDEPTNHLDLDSINSLEMILKSYSGALLMVTHDEKFVEEVGVNRIVDL